jgi:hypothetical protein
VPGRPPQPDSPYQPDRKAARPPAADARHTRDDVTHYDADAEFKRPVSKPEGCLPDDTGGRAPASPVPREHEDRDTDIRAPHLAEAADGDRGDTLQRPVDHPDFWDPTDDNSPEQYGDPLTQPDGTRVPCFDGPPRREQTRQGWPGDCGIIATLGAVAAHRPDDITHRIRPREDGSHHVTLSEAHWVDAVSEPTGRDVELTVTPDLPVYDDDPGTPACAQARDGAAWCAVAEKAFAGVDQTWTADRREIWANDWAALCASDAARNAEKPRSGPPATGYVRLHQGTTPWEWAEALTQLTGQPAVVREFPSDRDEWTINRIIRTQLTDHKPVLVSSRKEEYEGEVLPHRLEAGHVYEVTGFEKGKVLLRNPWNYKHPEPMETDDFAKNISSCYSTLM